MTKRTDHLLSLLEVGIYKGIEILNEIKQKLLLPIITDVHNIEEAKIALKFVT